MRLHDASQHVISVVAILPLRHNDVPVPPGVVTLSDQFLDDCIHIEMSRLYNEQKSEAYVSNLLVKKAIKQRVPNGPASNQLKSGRSHR